MDETHAVQGTRWVFFLCFSRLSGQPQTKLAVLPTCAQMESKPPTLLIKKASFLCATTLQRKEKAFTFKFYSLWFVGNFSILKRSWGLMYTGCVRTKMLSTLHGWPSVIHIHDKQMNNCHAIT